MPTTKPPIRLIRVITMAAIGVEKGILNVLLFLIIAVAAVVLAMPISPAMRQSTPRAACKRANSIPISIARRHSSPVSASSAHRSRVPRRTLRDSSPATSPKS